MLEFDQFLAIEGCVTKERHLFIGSGKKDKAAAAADGEDALTTRPQAYGAGFDAKLKPNPRHPSGEDEDAPDDKTRQRHW